MTELSNKMIGDLAVIAQVKRAIEIPAISKRLEKSELDWTHRIISHSKTDKRTLAARAKYIRYVRALIIRRSMDDGIATAADLSEFFKITIGMISNIRQRYESYVKWVAEEIKSGEFRQVNPLPTILYKDDPLSEMSRTICHYAKCIAEL